MIILLLLVLITLIFSLFEIPEELSETIQRCLVLMAPGIPCYIKIFLLFVHGFSSKGNHKL